MKQPLIFRIFKNNQLQGVKQFEQDQIVIGRNPDSQLQLNEPTVSGLHCMVELRDTEYYISDLGSQNGTFKNGQAILDEKIQSGDEISVGPFKIIFYSGAPKSRSLTGDSVVTSMTDINKSSEEKKSVLPTVEKLETPKAEIPKAEAFKPIGKQVEKNISSEIGKSSSVNKIAKPVLRSSSDVKSKNKNKKTFAPPSEISDLKTYFKPQKGSSLEVVVAWKERVLNSYTFPKHQVVTVGSTEKANIQLPVSFSNEIWPIVDFRTSPKVNLTSDMTCTLVNPAGIKEFQHLKAEGRINSLNIGSSIKLEQQEVLHINIGNSDLVLIIRMVPSSKVPILSAAPLMTASELTSIIMSIVLVSLLALYIFATKPKDVVTEEEEVARVAQVIFKKPPVPEKKQNQEKPVEPPPQKTPPIIEKVKVSDETREATKKGLKAETNPGRPNQIAKKAAEVAPIPNSKNRPKKFTSAKQGGAIKIGDKGGGNAQSAQKDVSKIGLFSALNTGGVRSKLDKAYSGSGDIIGEAGKATGSSGMNENRPGDDLGSKFKSTGQGGKGTSIQGIAGIGTKGRSSGQSEYGSENGLGDKTNVSVVSGGAEEDFIGTIDKEAVRRVVRAGLREIRGCYERELNKLEKGERLEGKVVISWEIIAKGKAANVRVKSSTLGSAKVENCVRERLAGWIFPEPPEGMSADVTYPFTFKPQN